MAPSGLGAFGASSQPSGFGAPSVPSLSLPSSQPSLFGSTPQTPAFGTASQPSLFGSASQTPAFGAASQPSAFGAAPQTPAFGAAPQQPSAFGAASQPSAFGAASQPSAFGAPSQAGGFGATSQPSVFGATSQPSLFGAGTGAAASQPSLFGPSSAASLGQPSAFGGGAAATTPGSAFGAPAGALFSQGSLFGGAGTAAAPAKTSGLFGSTPALGLGASQPSQQGGLFGSFGAPASQAGTQLTGLGLQTNSSSFGGFGSAATTQAAPAFTSYPMTQQQQQELALQHFQQQSLGVSLPTRLNDLVRQLDPTQLGSPFQAALYNMVSPVEVERYQRPPHMQTSVFEKAMLNNPNPESMVPTPANGFDDLLRRISAQQARVKEHESALENVEKAVAKIEDSIATELEAKLSLYRRGHRELARKLLRLACRVERKACANDADAVMSLAELDHKRRLEAVSRSISAPAVFKDKLNDLVELAQATRAERLRFYRSLKTTDARSTAAMRDLLHEQLNGIKHLGEVCRKDDRDVAILETELNV